MFLLTPLSVFLECDVLKIRYVGQHITDRFPLQSSMWTWRSGKTIPEIPPHASKVIQLLFLAYQYLYCNFSFLYIYYIRFAQLRWLQGTNEELGKDTAIKYKNSLWVNPERAYDRTENVSATFLNLELFFNFSILNRFINNGKLSFHIRLLQLLPNREIFKKFPLSMLSLF